MTTTKTVGLMVLGGLLFAGCGGDATKPAENAAGSKPAAGAPSTPTTTTPTSVSVPGGGTASTGSLPADFPKDVPVYEGASVTSASTTGGVAGAVLMTSDAPDKVSAFYKDELAKQGWSKPQAIDMSGTSTITATKDKRRVSVAITKAQDGKTSISLGVTTMP
jgi:hypothetical protein